MHLCSTYLITTGITRNKELMIWSLSANKFRRLNQQIKLSNGSEENHRYAAYVEFKQNRPKPEPRGLVAKVAGGIES